MMTHEFILKTAPGVDLHVYQWLPAGEQLVKAVLQIAHGMAEHAARYDEFARFLNTHGIAVYANDHRGHGKTAGTVDNLGFLAVSEGWQKTVDDLKELSRDIKNKHPHLPLFVMGHSMGSFLMRHVIASDPVGFQGAILSGTAGHPGLLGHTGIWLTKMLLLFNHPKTPAPLMDTLSFKTYNKAFKPNRTAFDWLSRDPEKVDEYISDPYCGTVFSIQFYNDLLKGLIAANAQPLIDSIEKNLPVLLMSGDKDPVGGNGKGVEEVYHKYQKAGIKDVTLKLFKDGRHELLNETNREEVYRYVLTWIEAHM